MKIKIPNKTFYLRHSKEVLRFKTMKILTYN